MKRVFESPPFRLLERVTPWLFALYGVIDIFQASAVTMPNRELVFRTLNLVLLAVALLSLLSRLLRQQTKPTVLIAVLLLGGAATALCADLVLFLALMVFSVLLEEEPFDSTVKRYLLTAVPVFLLIVGLSLIGVIPHLIFSRGEVDRYCLGFGYTTFPQSFFLFIVLAVGYLTRGRTPVWLLFGEGAVAFLLYRLTDSRAGFYLTALSVLCSLALRLFGRLGKRPPAFLGWRWVRFFVSLIPLILTVVFFLLSIFYTPSSHLLARLNGIFSDRLRLTRQAFATHPLTPFGAVIDWGYAPDYYGVDCSFFHYLFNYGIFAFLFLLIFYGAALYTAMKKENYALVLALLFCLADGIVEPYLLDFKYNVFALYAGQLLLSESQTESRFFRRGKENSCRRCDL